MADSYDIEDDDTVRLYGAFRNSGSAMSVPKLRATTSDTEKAGPTCTAQEENERVSDEIPESSHSNLPEQEDTKELLSPLENRAQEESPERWVNDDDDISIAPKNYGTGLPCWQHPKVRKNWRIVLGSVVLSLVGIVLLCVGTFVQITHSTKVQSFVFFIAGIICLIPGAYHVIYIYLAVKGTKGYQFSHLPMLK